MQYLFPIAVALLAVVQPQDVNRRVHDFAGLLSPEQHESLEAVARDVEQKTTAQLAIVTVDSLDGLTVDQYANQLFNEWGIGSLKNNNGVLLLVAPNERRMKVEVGYGLEPLLTDSLSGEIADNQIVPRFRQNDYAGGIDAGTRELARLLLADPAAARRSEFQPGTGEACAATCRVRHYNRSDCRCRAGCRRSHRGHAKTLFDDDLYPRHGHRRCPHGNRRVLSMDDSQQGTAARMVRGGRRPRRWPPGASTSLPTAASARTTAPSVALSSNCLASNRTTQSCRPSSSSKKNLAPWITTSGYVPLA